MDADIYENREKEFALEKLLGEIDNAKVMCLSPKELIDELLLEPIDIYGHKLNIINRLLGIGIEQEADIIIYLINYIIKNSEDIPSNGKPKTDSYLNKLIYLLPPRLGAKYAFIFLDHKRKNRRNIGFKYLKCLDYDEGEANLMIERYTKSKNQTFLEHLARNFNGLTLSDDKIIFVLQELNEEYWRCRIIEKLINVRYIDNFLEGIFKSFPLETFHAMGRTKNRGILNYIEQYINDFKNDYNSLGMVAWALGKVKAKEKLDELRIGLLKGLEKR